MSPERQRRPFRRHRLLVHGLLHIVDLVLLGDVLVIFGLLQFVDLMLIGDVLVIFGLLLVGLLVNVLLLVGLLLVDLLLILDVLLHLGLLLVGDRGLLGFGLENSAFRARRWRRNVVSSR